MKKSLFNILLVFPLICALYGCEETTELKIGKNVPVLVVDGLITDDAPPYFIKLSTTTDFNDELNGKAVNDAQVRLSDNTGQEETLVLDGEGLYKISEINGIPGRTYFLEINWQGKTYTSSDLLHPVGDIDSLNYRFREESIIYDEGYFVSYFGEKSNPESINYYRWIISKNNEPQTLRSELIVDSDEFVNGLRGLEFDFPFNLNDTASVAVYSLSKPVFDYYSALFLLVNNDGGVFSVSPENPPSNITNGALGFFQASSVKSDTVIIK
ncbi:DUF4249 domain-containing protein [Fulvivirgaceae bacterium BMA12]|uniref:DUF4249 domain-containing protein n=1 Tax=Agaribacillus aureus TaxID=3051825 RepID=A0ABT8L9A9_9BACT|nr:DUF4249 domain-containing protein [Fulvivirgaceae bacterium BMA12]